MFKVLAIALCLQIIMSGKYSETDADQTSSGNSTSDAADYNVKGQQDLLPDWIAKLKPVDELPDPFLMRNGQRVKSVSDWQARRKELIEDIQLYEYGHIDPPEPVSVISTSSDTVIGAGSSSIVRRMVVLKTGKSNIEYKVNLFLPRTLEGPFPVIVDGDLGWQSLLRRLGVDNMCTLVSRGYVIAEFDRTVFAVDKNTRANDPPDKNYDTGALIRWAWGFHRTIDFLLTQSFTDKSKIIVTGHSRGGKAALLAGALDERITLTAPNCSGTSGSGPIRFVAEGGEKIENITKSFPFWFCSRFRSFTGTERERLPFDQHSLIALVAPRAYLSTSGLQDLWANPRGTAQAHLAAKEVFVALGAADKAGIFYADTKHNHDIGKWEALVNFADKVFYGRVASYDYESVPFNDLEKAYSWSAPFRAEVKKAAPVKSYSTNMVFPGKKWKEKSPQSQGVDPAALEAALEFFHKNSGGSGTDQMVIVRNGYIIWKGPEADTFHEIFSATKIFTSTVMGMLATEGKLEVTDFAAKHFPEITRGDMGQETYKTLRLMDLASMSGGYDPVEPDCWNLHLKGLHKESLECTKGYIIPGKPRFSPGTKWSYRDPEPHMLGNIMIKITGKSLSDMFKEGIADKIGMTNWKWSDYGLNKDGVLFNNPAGTPNEIGAAEINVFQAGMWTTPLDFARLGLLYLNRGKWNGVTVLDSGFTRMAISNRIPVETPPVGIDNAGRYGFYWWTNGIQKNGKRPWPSAPAWASTAHGHGSNFCYVIPEWNMVIVRMSSSAKSSMGSKREETWEGFFKLLKPGIR